MLREAVAARATDERALYLLAEAERVSGDLEAAEAMARRLIAQNAKNPRGYVVLAEALEEQQQYQGVVDALAPAVASFRAAANDAGSRSACSSSISASRTRSWGSSRTPSRPSRKRESSRPTIRPSRPI